MSQPQQRGITGTSRRRTSNSGAGRSSQPSSNLVSEAPPIRATIRPSNIYGGGDDEDEEGEGEEDARKSYNNYGRGSR